MRIADSAPIAGREVNVVICAGDCSLSVLPAFGGKIASIQVKGRELLQQPLAPIEPRTKTMPFDAGDASGWDECLPSVAACHVVTAAGAAEIPDHGDLWRVEWSEGLGTRDEGLENARQKSASGGQTVCLLGECFSLPLTLRRTLTLAEAANGWRLQVDYKVTNTGSAEVPWSWAVHPLFAVEPGDRVILPDSIRSLRVEGSGGKRLGKNDDTVAWPIARLANGAEADLSQVEPPDSDIGDKLFAGALSAIENWCALERPAAGVRIRVRFDTEKTPYLGLWLCYGGWPERDGPKQNCVALEPSTAPVDSLALRGPWSRSLKPGESFDWAMTVDFELI